MAIFGGNPSFSFMHTVCGSQSLLLFLTFSLFNITMKFVILYSYIKYYYSITGVSGTKTMIIDMHVHHTCMIGVSAEMPFI